MSVDAETISSIVFALGWTVIHSIWQCSLIALFALAISQLTALNNSNLRCNLYSLSMVICGAWSTLTFSQLYKSRVTQDIIAPTTGRLTETMAAWSASELPVEMRFLVWIALFWGIGILFFLVKLVTEVIRSWLLKRQSTEIHSAEWQIALARLKKNIGVSRDVAICLSQKLSIPCVVGYFNPIILLPSSVFLGLSPLQIEMIILHELAHIRRNDVLINYVQIVLKIVFFFNPALLYLSRCTDLEREHACDDLAVQACGDAFLYARTLQVCAEMNLSVSRQIAFGNQLFERNTMLKQRVFRLFMREVKSQQGFKKTASVFGLLVLSLTIASCSLLKLNEADLDIRGKGVRFEISIKRNGEILAQPVLLSEFGQKASVEVDNQIKIVSIAQKPQGQRSYVESLIYQNGDKGWILIQQLDMSAAIAQTPSFEYTTPDKQYRIVIKQRLADLPR
ncbi:M56 family metallopeptidase [Undibacterium sp. FT79W]|uniref:M56 family metallopeptidase n=1 Tax=Undibacterium sp. FT79W TaxID=2762296 RepID=UPI00164A6CB0|nr:M56 family metallopeptidase [Undibacterium sp. FT79W]MBC3877032.1 M56 family metallopeptidase [Undibacterium sp. FT79W]